MFRAIWLVGVLLIIAACSPSATPPATSSAENLASQSTVAHILTIDEFADIMANQSAVYTVVNVHIPYEGEIEGTDMQIAYNDVNALTAALPDKDTPIILYCRSGNMSAQATRTLVELGYSQIYDVPGGMIAWQASGRPIVDR